MVTLTAVPAMLHRPRPRSLQRRQSLSLWRDVTSSAPKTGAQRRDDATSVLPGEHCLQPSIVAPPSDLAAPDCTRPVPSGDARGHSTMASAIPRDDTPRRVTGWVTDPHDADDRAFVLPSADALLQAASPFVAELIRTWHDRRRPCMVAGFDDGCSLLIDFAQQQVQADATAWERLLARRELPRLSDGTSSFDAPSHLSKMHPLESLIWAVGLAAGRLPLLGAHPDWRNARLIGRSGQQIPRLTRAPMHLHLARLVLQGETTPEQLRLAARVNERDLRAFLQAALFLRVLEWSR